jgi:mannose-6-phosphate isomerase-like protein (cupin superfamily)
MSASSGQSSARFDVNAIAAALPDTATTLLVDHYPTDREAASARVFRVYRPTPPHYHANCDEYLFVLSGRGTFWMEDASTEATFGPWSSCPLTRHGATRKTSSSSILVTALPPVSWRATQTDSDRLLFVKAWTGRRPRRSGEGSARYRVQGLVTTG